LVGSTISLKSVLQPAKKSTPNLPNSCRNLTKDEPLLQQRAIERWYVADPSKAQDLEKLRENHLLREFKQYCQTEKRLKEFRLEVF